MIDLHFSGEMCTEKQERCKVRVHEKDAKLSDRERLRRIVVNYLSLSIECAGSKEKMELFKQEPLHFLRDYISMTFPADTSNIRILLDYQVIRWPIIWVFFSGKSVKVKDARGNVLTEVEGVIFNEKFDVYGKTLNGNKENSEGEVGEKFLTSLRYNEKQSLLKFNDIADSRIKLLLKANDKGRPGDVYLKSLGIDDIESDIPFPLKECFIVIQIPFLNVFEIIHGNEKVFEEKFLEQIRCLEVKPAQVNPRTDKSEERHER